MKELVEYIVKGLVTKPEQVTVEESLEGDRVILTIRVDQDDAGLVIGKNGKTINSIRNLAKVKAIKDGVFVDVRIDTGDVPKKDNLDSSDEDEVEVTDTAA